MAKAMSQVVNLKEVQASEFDIQTRLENHP